MLSGPEMAAWLADAIRSIYERPHMYGRTLDEIDLAIFNFNVIYAVLQQRERHFYDALSSLTESTTNNFRASYLSEHPEASEQEVLDHVLSQWKLISNRLGISTEESAERVASAAETEKVTAQPTISKIETVISGQWPAPEAMGVQLYVAEGGPWGEIRQLGGELVLELRPAANGGVLAFHVEELLAAIREAKARLRAP